MLLVKGFSGCERVGAEAEGGEIGVVEQQILKIIAKITDCISQFQSGCITALLT